ncbi:MAG: SufS family cysteine desulfurase [Spirochaetia bacterium]|nr:SufS family cysteine desulfurase [Spirochaetia bacterium]
MNTEEQLISLGKNIRKDFPFFQNNPNTVYLDTAATSLVPKDVIENIVLYYEKYGANVHRGVYKASAEASEIYENTRKKVRDFVSAPSDVEVIFTKNTTESLNLLAHSLSSAKSELNEFFSGWNDGLKKDDVILLSESEHHSNIVPWQIVSEKTGASLEYIPVIKESGALDLAAFENMKNRLEGRPVKIISLAHVSNVTGIVYDLTAFSQFAKEKGAIFITDGAQSVCHQKLNFTELGCDFFAFSAHKMAGPKGIGVLLGKKEILKQMPPFCGGGDMILEVEKAGSTYNEPPYKFEAGTPNVGGVFGLSSAIDYLNKIGMNNIAAWENKLTLYAMKKLSAINVQFFGPSAADIASEKFKKVGVVSFGLEGIHPHDVGTMADEYDVCIRVGHHCCQLLMKAWKVSATCRASFYLYNDFEDIDRLTDALEKTRQFFRR